MAFTEFYCQTTGSNLNAGSTTDNDAIYTATNGGWDSATGIFTPTAGDPSATVSAGMFASVYIDGASVGVFVGRVTTVDATTITVSTTAKSGTAPTTNANARTIKVGGAWKGPNGAEGFPFNFAAATMTNAAGDTPRVNLKNNATYEITAAMTHAVAGPVRFQGYATTPGDLSKATIQGPASGASFVLLSISGANTDVADLILTQNGDAGTSVGFSSASASELLMLRCVVHSVRGTGIDQQTGGGANHFVECEAYACNQSNTAANGGFTCGSRCLRCISHDNVGSNSAGFVLMGGTVLLDCISDSNAGDGVFVNNSLGAFIRGCDIYNNGGDGIEIANTTAASLYIENCNLIDNGGYGINGSGAGARAGAVVNCGFGSGTAENTSGTTTGLKSMAESGSVIYAANLTPWADPGNGNFTLSLDAAKFAGRGSYTQTASNYGGTTSYPPIGATSTRQGKRVRYRGQRR